MPYEVEVSGRAARTIRSMGPELQARVLQELRALATEPRPPGVVRLHGRWDGAWRTRVGDYRVVYTVDDAARVVRIATIGHRSRVYE